MTAEDVYALLAKKHEDALIVPECKSGSTMLHHIRMMDAWVMLRTWSPTTFIGYEIKVSRSDFLADHKWVDYLPLCHLLYFVAPKGVILPGEIPEKAGHLEVSTGGRRLLTRKSAPRREIEMPINLLLYVLMSRTKIVASTYGRFNQDDRAAYWRQVLREKQDHKELGYAVENKIGKAMRELEERNTALETENRRCQEIRDMLKILDVEPRHAIDWHAQRLKEVLANVVGDKLFYALTHVKGDIERVLRELKRLQDKADGREPDGDDDA